MILGSLVKKDPCALLGQLPRLVETVVKSLDPHTPALRDACLKSTTAVLHMLVKVWEGGEERGKMWKEERGGDRRREKREGVAMRSPRTGPACCCYVISRFLSNNACNIFVISFFDFFFFFFDLLLLQKYPMVSFHQESQRLAVGTSENVIIIYDLKTATRWHVLEGVYFSF
jgi:hypothetical protein